MLQFALNFHRRCVLIPQQEGAAFGYLSHYGRCYQTLLIRAEQNFKRDSSFDQRGGLIGFANCLACPFCATNYVLFEFVVRPCDEFEEPDEGRRWYREPRVAEYEGLHRSEVRR